MPDRADLIFVVAGVALAAVTAMILRRRAERREVAARLWTKQLSVAVINSSEELRSSAIASSAGGAPSLARWVEHDSSYRAAVRGLRAGVSSPGVKAALSELEQARQQVLIAVVARDADFLQSAVHGLDEAVESFATASSIMVRLA
ncbi:hypothetical protein ACQPZJ_02610 [Actinoplanes sp. CA-054009]